MNLTKLQLIEIILRQFPSVPEEIYKQLQGKNNRVILKEARKSGLNVVLRNGMFIINQNIN